MNWEFRVGRNTCLRYWEGLHGGSFILGELGGMSTFY